MKHKFTFFAVVMMALAMPLQAQLYDFSAVAPSGQTLYYKVTNGGASIVPPHYLDYGIFEEPTGELAIPDSVSWNDSTYAVVEIGTRAFRLCDSLTSVHIPGTVTKIQGAAFENCTSIAAVSGGAAVDTISAMAFQNCSTLTSFAMPESVVYIGQRAFWHCTGLTAVTIPEAVAYIGPHAFDSCSNLTTINFNATLYTGFGNAAFVGCDNVTALHIGDSVQRIPQGLFQGLLGITSLVIPDAVTHIMAAAFYGLPNLTNLVIGSSVWYIGSDAFGHCTSLQQVNMLPQTPPTLVSYPFFYGSHGSQNDSVFSQLTISVPCGSGEAYRAAEGWNQFNNIVESCDTLPCDTVQLPYLADFTRCWTADNGAVVNSPQSVSLMGQGQKIESSWIETLPGNVFVAFTTRRDGEPLWDGTEDCLMTVENEDGEIYYTRFTPGDYSEFTPYFTSPGGLVRVRFEYIGSTPIPSFQLTNVAVFQYPMSLTIDCPAMASVGDTVTAIFRAQLPDGDNYDYITKEVYEYATGNWIYDERIVAQTDTSLSFVINTAGRYGIVSDLAKYDVFAGHTARITEWIYIDIVDYPVFYEDSIYYTSTAKDTVVGCHPQLHNAHLPGSVRKLNYNSFNYNRNLQSIVIEDGLTDIEYYSFSGCSNLASVSLPGTLTHIGRYAFGGCSSLERIDLPQSLTALDEGAFWYCTALDSLVFPDHIRTLGRNLMDSCISLTYVHLPDSLEYADTSLLRFCTALRHVDLPQHINRIEGWALMQCHSLESLDVPEGVTSIGETALYNDFNLAKLRLPSTLRSLGNIAMAYCQSLDTIWVAATTPPTCTQSTFNYTNSGATLVVPCGTTESYRSTQWSYFNIVEDCGTEGIGDVEPMSAVIAIQNGAIVVEGAEDHPVSVYDINGRLLATAHGEHAPLQFNVPASGTYLVKVGDHPARRVVVVR